MTKNGPFHVLLLKTFSRLGLRRKMKRKLKTCYQCVFSILYFEKKIKPPQNLKYSISTDFNDESDRRDFKQ